MPVTVPKINVLDRYLDINKRTMYIIIAVVVVAVALAVMYFKTDYFTDLKNKITGTSLKSLDVVMFMSPTCGHCQQMLQTLAQENKLNDLMIIDVSKDEGKKIAEQFGAADKPVPSFISRKKHTGTFGSKQSVAQLIKDLTENNVAEPTQQVQQQQVQQPVQNEKASGVSELVSALDIIMFSRDGCGHCVNAKDQLSQNGLMGSITNVDVTTPEGSQMFEKMVPLKPGASGRAVPSFVSKKTGKIAVGFKSIDSLLDQLN
jgi:glutaredoxin